MHIQDAGVSHNAQRGSCRAVVEGKDELSLVLSRCPDAWRAIGLLSEWLKVSLVPEDLLFTEY